MHRYAYLNNQFLPENKAKISIFDLGFLRGFGVFDTTAVENGKIHALEDHLKRFAISAEKIGLKLTYPIDEISRLSKELVFKNNIKHSSIKWILTGGISADGRFVDRETFIIINQPRKPFPKSYYTNGVKVITNNKKREIPDSKTLNYQIAYSQYPEMEKIKAFELIYTPGNKVLEGATSNIFIVKNNLLITPKNDILLGITRKEVIRTAKNLNIEVKERTVKKSELFDSDEVFITASFKGIMPVIQIDKKIIGSGEPGEITKKLMAAFSQ